MPHPRNIPRRLPRPYKDKSQKEWKFHKIVRRGTWRPWGYIQDPDDPDVLLPDEEKLKMMETAKRHVAAGKYPVTKIAEWLTYHTGEKIGAKGLKDRYHTDMKRITAKYNTEKIMKELVDIYVKARRIEDRMITPRSPDFKTAEEELITYVKEACEKQRDYLRTKSRAANKVPVSE